MRKKIQYIFGICFVGLLMYGCQQSVNKKPKNTFAIKGSVHEMNLFPEPPPEFPDHEGKAEFVSYCSICHSLKYVTMQPDFPAKTWEAEVNKMVAKYHAPIDSITGRKITAYLVAVKSKH